MTNHGLFGCGSTIGSGKVAKLRRIALKIILKKILQVKKTFLLLHTLSEKGLRNELVM